MNGRSLWAINIAIGALLVWGAVKIRKDWNTFASAHQAGQVEASPARPTGKVAAAASPVVADVAWTDILSRNPFSFDRNDVNLTPVAEVARPPAGPKPILFGVVDLGAGRVALLGEFGARRSSQGVKAGEKFKDWTVVKIEDKTVIVQNGGVEETIGMGNVPVDRDGGKTVAATATVTTSAPAVSSPTAAPTTTTPPRGPATPIVAPPGTRVVNTPFGPIVEQVQ